MIMGKSIINLIIYLADITISSVNYWVSLFVLEDATSQICNTMLLQSQYDYIIIINLKWIDILQGDTNGLTKAMVTVHKKIYPVFYYLRIRIQ